MLVLTRKNQQQIQIGNNIIVTILQVKGQTVRVGIEAPREVRVVRGEIAGIEAAEKSAAHDDKNHPLPKAELSNEEREVLTGSSSSEVSEKSVTMRRAESRTLT